MSQFTGFDDLPLIVHDCILRSLPSPRDVANTIRASPGSLCAFVTGRRSILLSAMRNFLSLENQHLMNLVMAAPQYFEQRQVTPASASNIPVPHCHDRAKSESKATTSSCTEFDNAADFNKALWEFVNNGRHLQPLTLKTFDRSVNLFAIIDKAIAGYSLFTIARSQRRTPMLSTPEASRLWHKYLYRDDRTPDDEELSKLWRGFLLYDLTCVMHGIPRIKAAALGKKCRTLKKVLGAREVFEEMHTYMQEEVMCVKQYIREQYDLAFNELVESFELAVGDLGRRASNTTQPAEDEIMPIIELEDGVLDSSVQYLFEPPYDRCNAWTANMARLGINFFQQFVSWDSAARLDFSRITYPFLGRQKRCPIGTFPTYDFSRSDLFDEWFGWFSDYEDELDMYDCLGPLSESRLRAVGWIFWKNPERLYFMNLDEDTLVDYYGSEGTIYPHLRVQGRPRLMETLVRPHDWERVCQHFGPSFSRDELKEIKGLFTSIESLKSSHIAEIVRIVRRQDVGVAPTEARKDDD